jgi:hypothetical protein
MIVCGSLIKAPTIQPCSTKLKATFFLKKKRVSQQVYNDGNWWLSSVPSNIPDKYGKFWDSVSVDIYIPSPAKK